MKVFTFDTNVQTALLNSTIKKWVLVFNILPLRTLLTKSPRTSCLGLASPTRAYSPAIQIGNHNSKLFLVIRLLNELSCAIHFSDQVVLQHAIQNFFWQSAGHFSRTSLLPARKANPSDSERTGPYVHTKGPYEHIVKNLGREKAVLWAVELPDRE